MTCREVKPRQAWPAGARRDDAMLDKVIRGDLTANMTLVRRSSCR